MARADPAAADPGIPAKDAPAEAAQRLRRVRANLRLPDRPFAALSRDHDAGLRALRLLDFVRLDLPSSGVPRADLVADLVANYSATRGRSSVRGEQVEVSLEADADGAARASASREFARVYIGAPAEASTGIKRRLPSIFFDKNVKRGPDYTTELLWELLKQEMEHMVESESTGCVSYYAAFLQRLIWVQRPELFQPPSSEEAVAPAALCVQPPPESLSSEEAVAPTALCLWKAQESNLPTIHENHECCSESDICRAEASPKQVDMASKTAWSAVSDKGYILTQSRQDDAVPRKTASRRALRFEGSDVANEVGQDLPPVVAAAAAAAPLLVLGKKGPGRPCKVQTAPVEPENRSPCEVQTALVEPENRSTCIVQTAPVDPENRRFTRGSIKSNGFKPAPVVDQQARPKKQLSAKVVLKKQTPAKNKKQTPARPQGTMIKQMKRKK
ncbi:uncharacterized protein LOC124664782 [Lolium rigidum]|uniref:uncharacterized protein LOC124664782 n=1 Tax=Lolium rigidum TaxID=89674 RepID=UPI001F5CD1C2|nr:uncharacterized protein LOC124664782 [Lolium rigidum]